MLKEMFMEGLWRESLILRSICLHLKSGLGAGNDITPDLTASIDTSWKSNMAASLLHCCPFRLLEFTTTGFIILYCCFTANRIEIRPRW